MGRRVNRGFEYSELLRLEADGLTLLDYLSRHYAHSTREEWRSRIDSGLVLLQEIRTAPGTILRSGQRLVWRRPPWREPPAPLCFAVLYRDDHLLAVAKPPGLPTLPGGGYLENTLLALTHRYDPPASPLHRLDRGTSGILLLARTRRARRDLAAAWRRGEVRKSYRALVHGLPERDQFTVDAPIGPVGSRGAGSVYGVSSGGRTARTIVRALERREEVTVVEARLSTGRSHQVRIHLAAAGHPLVGDPLYVAGGLPHPGCAGRPGETGFLLHAGRLEFTHPVSRRPVVIDCAPPRILRLNTAIQ